MTIHSLRDSVTGAQTGRRDADCVLLALYYQGYHHFGCAAAPGGGGAWGLQRSNGKRVMHGVARVCTHSEHHSSSWRRWPAAMRARITLEAAVWARSTAVGRSAVTTCRVTAWRMTTQVIRCQYTVSPVHRAARCDLKSAESHGGVPHLQRTCFCSAANGSTLPWFKKLVSRGGGGGEVVLDVVLAWSWIDTTATSPRDMTEARRPCLQPQRRCTQQWRPIPTSV